MRGIRAEVFCCFGVTLLFAMASQAQASCRCWDSSAPEQVVYYEGAYSQDACKIRCKGFDQFSSHTAEERVPQCDASDSVPPAGPDLYPSVTATGTIDIPGFGVEEVTFTGYMINERGDPYCLPDGRYAFDWYTIERNLAADTSLGEVKIIQDAGNLEVAVAESDDPPGTDISCYGQGGVFPHGACLVHIVDTGIEAYPAEPALMESMHVVHETPPVNAHFNLVEPVDYVTEVSREVVFTLLTLELDTGPLTRGACLYDPYHCFVVPQYTCGNGRGAYLGDGSTCPEDLPVPAVSEWGLIAMMLLALTAGTIVLMRRRPVAG